MTRHVFSNNLFDSAQLLFISSCCWEEGLILSCSFALLSCMFETCWLMKSTIALLSQECRLLHRCSVYFSILCCESTIFSMRKNGWRLPCPKPIPWESRRPFREWCICVTAVFDLQCRTRSKLLRAPWNTLTGECSIINRVDTGEYPVECVGRAVLGSMRPDVDWLSHARCRAPKLSHHKITCVSDSCDAMTIEQSWPCSTEKHKKCLSPQIKHVHGDTN